MILSSLGAIVPFHVCSQSHAAINH